MRVYAIAPHTVGCWTIFPENCKVKLLQVVGMCWVATAGCCWTDGGLPQAEALPTVGTGRHPSAPACMQEGARARWAVEVNVAGIWMMRVRAVVAAVRYANNSKDSMGGRETVETNSSSKQSSNGITTVTTRARIRDRAEQTRCCDRLMALALAALAPPARSTMRPIQSNAMGMRPERSGAVVDLQLSRQSGIFPCARSTARGTMRERAQAQLGVVVVAVDCAWAGARPAGTADGCVA